jgi:hypothetical protein
MTFGEPIRSLLQPHQRWRQTLKQLAIRYRKPYSARHTSVSWNLMIGTGPLRTAKQHGHSVETMWRVYSAWMEGAVDSDIEAIKSAMQLEPGATVREARPAAPIRPCPTGVADRQCADKLEIPTGRAVELALQPPRRRTRRHVRLCLSSPHPTSA